MKPTIRRGSMTRRSTSLLSVAAATGMLVVGATVVGPSLPASASTRTPSLGHIGGSLTVWSEWTSAEQSDFQASIQAFESETGITVNYRGIGSNIAATVQAAVAGGKGPDVAFVPSPATLDALAAKRPDQARSASVIGSEATNYAPVWNQLASYNGKQYGVWFKAANKNTIWYNPAEFAVAGIKTPPTTWQGLIGDAATLHAAGVVPVSLCTDIGWPVADMWQNVYLKTAGAADYDKLAAHQIPWTDPTVTTAFDTMAQLIGKPQYLLGGTLVPSERGALPRVRRLGVPQGRGHAQGGHGHRGRLRRVRDRQQLQQLRAGHQGRRRQGMHGQPRRYPVLRLLPFPAPAADKKNSAALQGSGDVAMMINSTPQAKAFMQYIASPLPGEIWARIGGFASPNKERPSEHLPRPGDPGGRG
jgi:alpha-glucoside transport system substrate-binding protein